MLKPAPWGTILDRRLSFPLEAAQYNTATLVFDVPFAAARALVPGAFEPVRTGPGLAQFVITASDYRRTDWGSCHQLCFAFLARPAGPGQEVPGLLVHRSPVDDAFTCAVGHGVMSYPVTIELIEVGYTPDRVTFDLAVGVQPALTLSLPRGTAKGPVEQLGLTVYSLREGVPHRMPMRTDHTPVLDPGADPVEITLGSGPLAQELRGLGLPRQPSWWSWGEDLTATFQAGGPV
ncbi:MAG: hypothetical protein ABIQ26_17735 [Streptosporangiaceae bacterium]